MPKTLEGHFGDNHPDTHLHWYGQKINSEINQTNNNQKTLNTIQSTTYVHMHTDVTRKQSQPSGTSAKAMLFARWRHHIHFASGSLMPPLTQS